MTPTVRVSAEPIGVEDLAAFQGATRSPYVVSYVERVPAGTGAVEFYTAFRELAEAAVHQVFEELLADAPEDLEVFVRYRLGELAAGEPMMLIAVRSARFEDAYGACGRLAVRLREHGSVRREPRR